MSTTRDTSTNESMRPRFRSFRAGAAFLCAGLLTSSAAGCPGDDPPPADAGYPFDLPPGFPAPRVPADNPMSDEKVELGRHLFYDTRLSGNQTQSCASCHFPERAFTDGKVNPTGSTGDVVKRNSQTLANVAYWSTYTWANPALATLEEQALVPLFGELPTELGVTPVADEVEQRFRDDADYAAMFAAAFPDDAEPVTLQNAVKALASFQRVLISGNSAFDRYFEGGDEDAISDDAKRGLTLFFSEQTECYHCHAGPLFSSAFLSASSTTTETAFENNGLYNLDGQGAYPPNDPGLIEFTRDPRDMGRFRVPSLRNVALTAPYMHDGSIATLDEVIEHYNVGGRTIAEGPNAGVGADSPLKNPLLRPLNLSDDDKRALKALLESLTDESFATDPRFADPFAAP
jgi:cytochrome c peroxidase